MQVGLMDKLKSLFGKGGKKQRADMEGLKPSVQFKGEGKVGDALRYAVNKLEAQVKAGKFSEKEEMTFITQLRACEASEASDDEKLIEIGQIIGAITFM